VLVTVFSISFKIISNDFQFEILDANETNTKPIVKTNCVIKDVTINPQTVFNF
jgi:hypothetical protein